MDTIIAWATLVTDGGWGMPSVCSLQAQEGQEGLWGTRATALLRASGGFCVPLSSGVVQETTMWAQYVAFRYVNAHLCTSR